MYADMRKQFSSKNKNKKEYVSLQTESDEITRKNSDLVHSINELEKNILLSTLTTDCDKIMKSLNVALNSHNLIDTETFLLEAQKSQTSVCKQSLNEALLSACSRGNKFLVLSLLAFNAEVNCRDNRQNTPLMLCAKNGFCDIARILIQRGADINCINDHGDSALILSVTNFGSTDLVQLLLNQKDIDVSHTNNDSHTCLSRAVELLDFHIIQIILQKIFKYSNERDNKNNMLQMVSHAHTVAKSFGIFEIFTYLTKEMTENKPALVIAVSQGDLESVRFLLNFVILSKNSNEEYIFEGIIMKILTHYEERNTDLNDNDIEIVKHLFESNVFASSYTFTNRDEDILAKAIRVGSYKLLDVLCQFIIKSEISNGLLQDIFFKGLCSACSSCSCECLSILLKYKSDLVQPYEDLTDFIKVSLKMGASDFFEMFINHISFDISGPLNFIVATGETKFFNLILNKFPLKAASVIFNSQNMLHTAAKVGNEDILLKLLNIGADVNKIYQEKTPLMYCRKPEVANILLQHGADINFNVKSSQSNVILNLFSMDYFCNVDTIYGPKSFLKRFSIIGKVSDIVIDMKKDLISLFIQHGADIEAKDSEGNTALMKAAKLEGFEKILEMLLKLGADPDQCNEERETALHLAVSDNCLKNVETLLNFSADFNKKCYLGQTCLQLAAQKPSVDMIKLMFKYGANVQLEDDSGNSLLLLALSVRPSNNNVLKYLLDVGFNVNHQNKDGFSALMIAAENGWLEALKFLCESGANVNALRDEKNVVDILVEILISNSHYFIQQVLTCLIYILEKGGSAANVKLEFVFELISQGHFDLIQKLIYAGFSPSECPIEKSRLNAENFMMLPSVSPLCYALLNGNVELAQYFTDISFLTALDISDRGRAQIIRLHLNSLKCSEFIDDFYSHPMSLEKLCLITVSSSLGSGVGRENKVSQLPLPTRFKERLMYKTEDVLHGSHFDDKKRNILNSGSFINGMGGSIFINENEDYYDDGDCYYISDDSYGYDYC